MKMTSTAHEVLDIWEEINVDDDLSELDSDSDSESCNPDGCIALQPLDAKAWSDTDEDSDKEDKDNPNRLPKRLFNATAELVRLSRNLDDRWEDVLQACKGICSRCMLCVHCAGGGGMRVWVGRCVCVGVHCTVPSASVNCIYIGASPVPDQAPADCCNPEFLRNLLKRRHRCHLSDHQPALTYPLTPIPALWSTCPCKLV